MKRSLLVLLTSLWLTGCGATTALPAMTGLEAVQLDAASLGGLTTQYAAHPSVQLAWPRAFALTEEAGSFLGALDRMVVPMRERVADSLLADATVTQGLAQWARLSAAARLTLLKRVASIACQGMGCQVPAIAQKPNDATQPNLMAYFLSDAGVGQVVLYTDAIAKGGKYLAVATLVHELRHAAQDQLVRAGASGATDTATLVRAYDDAWDAVSAMGGESKLAYGDYAHLNLEFDAFQTGNQVAAIVSAGAYDAAGMGFIDVQYTREAVPVLNLLTLSAQFVGTSLIAAVNKAEFDAERARGGVIQRQRPQRGGTRFGR